MDAASEYGHLAVVKFLHEHRTEGCTTDAMDEAAGNGHFDIVRYLHNHRYEGCATQTLDHAARRKNGEYVEWLGLNRTEGESADSIRFAVMNEIYEMVKFLTLQCKNYCDSITLQQLIEITKRFDVVEWLLKHNNAVSHVVDGNPFIDL